MNVKDMIYTPLHTDWYYNYVDIPCIEEIKIELINLTKISNKKFELNPIYFNFNSDVVLENCPALAKYLTSVGLKNKFNRLLVSNNVNIEKRPTVHIDSYDPKFTTHSLNIGLIDHEQSYTVWYKTKKIKLRDSSSLGLNPYTNYAYLFIQEAEEIKRVEYELRPILVNTTILHRGISDKPTRLICGLRFCPELTDGDIKNLGVKNPHIQEQNES
jgi:hypothetical protein